MLGQVSVEPLVQLTDLANFLAKAVTSKFDEGYAARTGQHFRPAILHTHEAYLKFCHRLIGLGLNLLY